MLAAGRWEVWSRRTIRGDEYFQFTLASLSAAGLAMVADEGAEGMTTGKKCYKKLAGFKMTMNNWDYAYEPIDVSSLVPPMAAPAPSLE